MNIIKKLNTSSEMGLPVSKSAKGATLFLQENRTVVDLASGGFGYSHPKIIDAVEQQIVKLPLSPRVFFTPSLAVLCDKLSDKFDGKLPFAYPCNSADEALDGALKLAKGRHKERFQIALVEGSSKGRTVSTAEIINRGKRRNSAQNLFSPYQHLEVPFNDVQELDKLNWSQVGAFVLEPVLCGGEIKTHSKEFINAVKMHCKRSEALLILDERFCGFGVAGNFSFANQIGGADVVVLGHSLGGGVVPCAAYVASEALNAFIYKSKDPVLHATTTGANPASCVAALSALEVYDDLKLAEKATKLGNFIECKIEKLRLKFPDFDMEISGGGLLWSLRFGSKINAAQFKKVAFEEGVLLRSCSGEDSAVLQIRAPLLVSEVELESAFLRLEKSCFLLSEGS